MLKVLKILAIILLVASIITTVLAVQAFSPSPLPFEENTEDVVLQYHAVEIGKPLQYWVLTDPDEYILDAIAHAHDPPIVLFLEGKNRTFVYYASARANETTFVYQVYDHGQIWDIEYEGLYYAVDATYYWDWGATPHKYYRLHKEDLKEETITAGSILGASWIALGTLWIKKKPKPQ